MSDTPKFEVIDRRKLKAMQEEEESRKPVSAPEAETAPVAAEATTEPAEQLGPRLVVSEPKPEAETPVEPEEELEPYDESQEPLPQAPNPEDAARVLSSYQSAAQRIEDLIRAQNPAVGAQPPIVFENLVQQLYMTAMLQMGAGAQPGERPRIDIIGARTTIDLLGVLAEKTSGKLNATEDRMVQTVLYEVRSVFLELASMVSMPSVQPPTTPGGMR